MSASKTETTQAARVTAIVTSYVNGARNTKAAGISAMIDFAKTLEGISPISDETWKANYQEGVLAQLKASGTVSDASAPMTASKVKTAAQGVTHKIAWTDFTFTGYVGHCRSDDARVILGKAPKAASTVNAASAPSATANPAQYVADGFYDDAKGRKEAKALCERLGGAEMAMALMIVCDQSESLAGIVHAVLPSHEAEFRQFAEALFAAPKADAQPKANGRVRRA